MARRKLPERSKIERAGVRAFARKDRDDEAQAESPSPSPTPEAAAAVAAAAAAAVAAPEAEAAAAAAVLAAPAPTEAAPTSSPMAVTQPMTVVPPHGRAKTETMMMPENAAIGAPPDLPDSVEDPTNLPGPKAIPAGNPNDPAKAPGLVPKGDSRSLRRGTEFALVYRIQTFLISRFGTVGTRGQWRVVEYPTTASASHSYARETSRYLSEGYSDYRD
jgi:hypothetical protein